MFLHSIIICTIFFGSQIYQSCAQRHHLNLHLCMNNRTVSAQFLIGENDDPTCQCQVGSYRNEYAREDYIHTPGIGSHKLHTNGKSWNDARKICNQEDGHLAIINSKAEESVLLGILNKNRNQIKNSANTEEAYLGIHDFFKEGEWVTIYGESLFSTGYAYWSPTYWGGQPDNKDKNQNCGALIYLGGMDDVHCHEPFAFFCELSIKCA